MTLLMVWTNKKNDASAINIASDSRLSAGATHWDYGTKIHRLHPTSTWFGYCGNSFVGLSAIASATAAISNSDHLKKLSGVDKPSVEARVGAIRIHLTEVLAQLPKLWRNPATLILADHDHRRACFSAFTIQIDKSGIAEEVPIDLTSKRVHTFGTTSEANKKLATLEKKDELTTKTIVRTLVEVIDGPTASVGGPPQMVMLTKTRQMPIGFWWPESDARKRFLFGVPISFASRLNSVTWKTREFDTRPFEPFKLVGNIPPSKDL